MCSTLGTLGVSSGNLKTACRSVVQRKDVTQVASGISSLLPKSSRIGEMPKIG